MTAVRQLLRDRRRRQHGGVLSGVLIITAFLAIISGALMTELSGSFVLSHNAADWVANEATVNSEVELVMHQLGTTPISAGCPQAATVNANGGTAVGAYLACAPIVDPRSPRFTQVAPPSSFDVAGAHAVLPASGSNDYIVGDSGGTVHDYAFGRTSGWTLPLGGHVTGPIAAMTDPSGAPDVSTLVPVSQPTAEASGCTSQQACVALLSGPAGVRPSLQCYMPSGTPVVSAPAQGVTFPNTVYFGDSVGDLYAYDATENGACNPEASAPSTDGDDGVVAGPIVFSSSKQKSDIIYAVVGDNVASYLVRYTYSNGKSGLVETASLGLPEASAQGMAVEGTSLPTRVAVTFADGTVSVLQISETTMSVAATTDLGTNISDPPSWCHCQGSTELIGVGGANGALYLLGPSSLNRVATLPPGGPSIRTAPQSDGVGEWFFGGDDGYLYEAQQPAGQSALSVVTRYGPVGGAVGSGPQVGSCPAGLCAYFGSSSSGAYVVELDARDAVITACVASSPPACSGAKPGLWAHVQVGTASSAQAAHVLGWSYYSP